MSLVITLLMIITICALQVKQQPMVELKVSKLFLMINQGSTLGKAY